jgi:hypothetical protein
MQRAIKNIKFSPCALEQAARIDRGSLFEEGFATLGAYMYLWQKYPEVIADTRTEPRRSPDGLVVDLPVRHALYTNTYAYAAWAMERLTDFSPHVWNIFQNSRVYGANPENMRGALKEEVDKLNDKLFAYLDSVDTKDLTQVMQASEAVNVLVGRATGEGSRRS